MSVQNEAYPITTGVLSSVGEAGTYLDIGSVTPAMAHYEGGETLSLDPDDGVLVPVRRHGNKSVDEHFCEALLPTQGWLEAVPGIWSTGVDDGFALLINLSDHEQVLGTRHCRS